MLVSISGIDGRFPAVGVGCQIKVAVFEFVSSVKIDDVLDRAGNAISSTTTFNSAFYVPEPSALTALGSGIAMLALLYRRRAGA